MVLNFTALIIPDVAHHGGSKHDSVSFCDSGDPRGCAP